jgi:hypothetical protein
MGGSYGDEHLTPLGFMPGAMIIANAIHSLHRFGLTGEAGPLRKFAKALIPIVVAAFVLAALPCRADGRFGYYVAGCRMIRTILAVLLVLFVVALMMTGFAPDIWFYATLPCIGILVHQWFEVDEHGAQTLPAAPERPPPAPENPPPAPENPPPAPRAPPSADSRKAAPAGPPPPAAAAPADRPHAEPQAPPSVDSRKAVPAEPGPPADATFAEGQVDERRADRPEEVSGGKIS